jgi:hypothetical protein
MESDRSVEAASPIEQRILNLAKSQSTIRTRDAIAGGIHPEDLRRLVDQRISQPRRCQSADRTWGNLSALRPPVSWHRDASTL